MISNKNPLISVIIPTYNRSQLLYRCLESVISQTYFYWEAIVIDNYSNDNTEHVVNRFNDSRIIYLKTDNKGIIAVSRNMGIQAAHGEWVAFLDSDDWWAPNKLKETVKKFSDKIDFIYHDMKFIKENSLFYFRTKRCRQLKNNILMDALKGGNPIINSSVVVRKRLLKQIGGINEKPELIGGEDYNTWLRIAQITNKFHYINKKLGHYLIHKNAQSVKDMSIPHENAVKEFKCLLDQHNIRKIKSRVCYTRAVYAAKNGRISKAIKNLSISLRYGDISIKIRSSIRIMCLNFKKK